MSFDTADRNDHPEKLRGRWLALAIALILLLFAQCVHTAKADSVSWDESQHLYSGWLSWKHADFGFNPEVPPLVKMWCAMPLLHRDIKQPAYTGDPFKKEGFVLGQRFLAENGIDRTLIPARIMAAVLTALLATVILLCALEMFGVKAAIIALALFCFDPNFLAHGGYVTTDIGASLTMMLATFSFYRYVRRPSTIRMIVLGTAVGLTLTAKFTGIFIIPMLILISCLELIRRRRTHASDPGSASPRQLTGALILASAIGVASIWSIYHFRYEARPDPLELNPTSAKYLTELKSPISRSIMISTASHHLLPEAYLYGLADTKISAGQIPSYFFGRTYPRAPRWYFPASFAIKSTLPFLILLLSTSIFIVTGRWRPTREIIFLAVPPIVLFVIASSSDIGIGFRHLLPMYPFLYTLVAGCASYLAGKQKAYAYALGVLVLWQVVGSIAARPGLLAYANEAWGGPSNTHRYLSDSNTDWGQQLRQVKAYLDQHKDGPCYFAYFAQGPVDFRDYGIPCAVLPTAAGAWTGMDEMHFDSGPKISGTVLISDGVVSGADRPGKLNTYLQFQSMQPKAVIDRGVYVYEGEFDVSAAAARQHAETAQSLMRQKRFTDALAEAQTAEALDPESPVVLNTLGDAFRSLQQLQNARFAYTLALHSSKLEPEFQKGLITELQAKVEQLPPTGD